MFTEYYIEFYRFRGLYYDHHGWSHGNEQKAMVLEKKMRAYILRHIQKAETESYVGIARIF